MKKCDVSSWISGYCRVFLQCNIDVSWCNNLFDHKIYFQVSWIRHSDVNILSLNKLVYTKVSGWVGGQLCSAVEGYQRSKHSRNASLDSSSFHLGKCNKISCFQDSRISVHVTPDSVEWELSISGVVAGDGGLYQCQVNTNPLSQMMTRLSVTSNQETAPDIS